MLLDNQRKLGESTVTVEREGVYYGTWRIRGNKVIVCFEGDEEALALGMFEKDPEALARMLLAKMLSRRFGKLP